MQVENIKIHKVIMHEIHKKITRGIDIAPTLSDSEVIINDKINELLCTRLVEALGRNSNSCDMDIKHYKSNSFWSIASNSLKNDSLFIDTSKKIAEMLSTAQISTGIPGGQLIFIKGTLGNENHRFVCVVKAEYSDGLIKDNHTKSLTILDDIFLSSSTRLFKVGIFVCKSGDETKVENWNASIFDNNMKNDGTNAAIYFYKTFLGCDYINTSAIENKKFFDVTKAYIEKTPAFSFEQKHDLMDCLYTFMFGEKSKTFNAADFGAKYLDEEFRSDYELNIKKSEISMTAIVRDTSLIEKRKKRRLQFKGGIEFSYNDNDPNVVIENVKKGEGELSTDYWTKITIKGSVLGEK